MFLDVFVCMAAVCLVHICGLSVRSEEAPLTGMHIGSPELCNWQLEN